MDSTANYKKVFKSGSGESGNGKIAISNDKIYLLNDTCTVPVIVGDECLYPNCQPLIEFKYTDDKITIVNDIVDLIKK